MALQTVRARNPAGRGGLFATLLGLVNALATFVESRLALFTKESKAALGQLAAMMGALIAALLFFAFGYIFLVASAVVGLAHVAQISWIWTALIAAGIHFILALVCVLIARAVMTKRPFRETTEELKKDR